MNDMYEAYQEYKEESKACGYEYISWSEWQLDYEGFINNQITPKPS